MSDMQNPETTTCSECFKVVVEVDAETGECRSCFERTPDQIADDHEARAAGNFV